MNDTKSTKKENYVKIATSVSPKVDDIIRKQAFKERIPLGEMLERYQEAYLRELEQEKAEKKLHKELKEKGEVTCPKCNQTTNKLAQDK